MKLIYICLLLIGSVLVLACPDQESVSQQRIIGRKLALGESIHRTQIAIYSSLDLQWEEKQNKLADLRSLEDSANDLHFSSSSRFAETAERLLSALQKMETELIGFTSLPSSFGQLEQQDNCSCANDYNCVKIFANFTKTQQFLTQQSCTFIRELLADKRNDTVDTFLQLYSTLNFNGITLQQKDTFLESVVALLVNQTITNPPVFVSHGTDHSVRVMMYAAENYEIPEVLEGMNTLYECNNAQSKFVLMLHSLLHDVGYIWTPPAPDYKFLHALIGSILVKDLLALNGNLGDTIVEVACGTANPKLLTDFVNGIRNHNADDQSCLDITNHACIANISALSDQYEHTKQMLAPYSMDGIIHRNYTPEVALTDPIGFLIRLDDNLDSDRSRLTPPQRDPYLNLFLLRVYVDGVLRDAVVGGDKAKIATAMQQAKDDSQAYVRQWDPTWSYTTPDVAAIVGNITYKSFLYFYSTYILKELTLSNGTLTIDLFKEQIANLTYQEHIGAALYQINRLAVSMHSCSLKPQVSFLNSITVDLIPGTRPNVNESTYALKAFAQKPTYSINGTAVPGILVCGNSTGADCKNALFLTLSGEACFFSAPELKEIDPKNAKNETCCDFVALQKQITDLTFPTENTLCPYKAPSKSKGFPGWGIALIVVGGVVVLGGAVATVFLIRKRRLNSGEHAELIGDKERKRYT